MNNTVPEIRYDHMTDRALIDEESTRALHALSASWVARQASTLHPATVRAKRRQAALQRAWRAMAALRAAHEPFPLIQRLRSTTSRAITPLACINFH